jgi:hypothetical protein
MRVEIGDVENVHKNTILCVKKELSRASMPKTIDNKEYVAVVQDETINIFWATEGVECRCLVGSVLSQDQKGSRKIGFVDIFAENIVWSIWDLICDYWQKERLNVEANNDLIQQSTRLM